MTPLPARLWHLLHLTAILWRFTRRTSWLPVVRSRRVDLRVMAQVICRGWVRYVRDPAGPVGFIARDGGRIHALYVHPRAHGLGMGRVLLSEAKAQTGRLELWVAEHNHSARQFYTAQGFAEVAQGHGAGNDENLPDILMVWPAEQRMIR